MSEEYITHAKEHAIRQILLQFSDFEQDQNAMNFRDDLLRNSQNWRSGYNDENDCYWVTPQTPEGNGLPMPFNILKISGRDLMALLG